MILVDNTKVILVGDGDMLAEEIAFVVNKMCHEAAESGRVTYDEMADKIARGVIVLQKEQENGNPRSHPKDGSGLESKEPGQSAAEVALAEALATIDAMKKKKKGKKKKGGGK